jgi:hypothetical protein
LILKNLNKVLALSRFEFNFFIINVRACKVKS